MNQQNSATKDISILTKDFPILSYHADHKGRLSLSNLCNFLQEIAWNHANILGVGYDHLAENNQFWVLIRMYIEIYAYPLWQETITIHTWPKGTEAFMALRDFKVFDKAGSLAAAASTGWLILDKNTKRPVRLEQFRKRVPLREAEHALSKKLVKLDAKGETIASVPHIVGYSDLDVNNHVNNAKYTEWIMDAWYGLSEVPSIPAARTAVTRFEINFQSEAFLGEEVTITLRRTTDGTDSFCAQVFRGDVEGTGEEIIRARFSVSFP